jgi:hypothetical protein
LKSPQETDNKCALFALSTPHAIPARHGFDAPFSIGFSAEFAMKWETDKASNVAADLDTPSSLPAAGVNAISAALNVLLAYAFAVYLKTKNFHWRVSGRHVRDYHLMLDEQAEAIFDTTEQITERVRKIGGLTLRSAGQVAHYRQSATMTRNMWLPTTCCAN